jgi:hypothetical protein
MRQCCRSVALARLLFVLTAALAFASPSFAVDETTLALNNSDMEFRGELKELAEKCRTA